MQQLELLTYGKQISDIKYFKHLVVYIHNNPVHHGFVKYAMDCPWPSYHTIISVKPTHICRDEVISWIDNAAIFKAAHEKNQDDLDLENGWFLFKSILS